MTILENIFHVYENIFHVSVLRTKILWGKKLKFDHNLPLKNLIFLETSVLLGIEIVEDADFWVCSGGIGLIGVGGGGGGGGGGVEEIFDEANAGDAGADFGEDSAGDDCNTGNIGADFDVANVDFGVNVAADNADKSGGAGLSDITSGITSRGGECTSTILCCVLSFPCDSEMLSVEELLDLLLLLVSL